jgi:hypothetical protein
MSLPREIAHAALNGNLDTVRQFVESNPECVNDDVLIEDQDTHSGLAGGSISLLSLATIRNVPRAVSTDMVRFLMSRGADVADRKTKFGPLGCACAVGNVEAVALLLQAGANVHRIDYEASIHCSFPLKRDMIVHLCEKRTQTIAQVTDGIFECLRLLLRAGLALDVLQDGTTTPLEQVIVECMLSLDDAGHLGRSLDLVRAMRASMHTSASPRLSPWRQYVLAPSVEVLRLRSLVFRGRARERGVVSGPTPRPIAWLVAPRTPKEIVWNVLAFWNPRHE